MKEVLSLTYTPMGGLLVKVPALKESEHAPGEMVRQLGVPEPQATFTLDEIPVNESFAELLAALPDMVAAKLGAEVIASPKLTEQAAALAAEKHAYDTERKAREDALAQASEAKAKAEAEKAALDAEIAKARAEAAAEKAKLDELRAARAQAADVVPEPEPPETKPALSADPS
jgi:hypothetical protein